MDISSSMLAMDFDPNRLEASKKVAIDFIKNRPYDRIGLVVFAKEAFTFSPITTDHDLLNNFIEKIQVGMLKDGTAIGNGMAAAVNRLKDSKAKSKLIILLTDGENTAGYIAPQTAIDMAKKYNIKVYTIGIGSNGVAKTPVKDMFGNTYITTAKVVIDERLLTKIANETGGKYFRAQNLEELKNIYDYIDKLEKTKIEVKVFKRFSEEFRIFLIPGLILLLLIFLLKKSILLIKP
jgi:Ca-activated chloride channel family protein